MNAIRTILPVALAAGFSVMSLSVHAAGSAVEGSWLSLESGVFNVVTLLGDGHYIDARVVDGDAAHTGLEWGTYSWDASTGKITATASGDLNGNWGLADDEDGPVYATVNGNTGTTFQPGCPGCNTDLVRVLPTSSPVVGTWLGGSGASFTATTFLADGRYMHAAVIAGDPAHTGIEWGTYSWNAATGKITASSNGDLNGDWGFAGDPDGPQYMLVSHNTAHVFQPGCADCGGDVTRVLPAVPEVDAAAMAMAGMTLIGLMRSRRRARR